MSAQIVLILANDSLQQNERRKKKGRRSQRKSYNALGNPVGKLINLDGHAHLPQHILQRPQLDRIAHRRQQLAVRDVGVAARDRLVDLLALLLAQLLGLAGPRHALVVMAVGLLLDGVADRRDGHFGMDLVDALVAVADAVELADARAQRWGEFFAAARHCW